MKWLLILAFSTYCFGDNLSSRMRIRQGEFQRYGIPQINNIIRDFYNSLNLIQEGSLHKDLAKSYYQFFIWQEETLSYCERVSFEASCHEKLSAGEKILTKLELGLFQQAQLDSLPRPLLLEQKQELTSTLEMILVFKQVVLQQPQNLKLTDKELIQWIKNWKSELLSLNLQLKKFVLKAYPQVFREQIDLVWGNFIIPLNHNILGLGNIDYLKHNVDRLNQIWNEYHMSLTKRRIKVNKAAESLLTIMQRRWNSILKITLRF